MTPPTFYPPRRTDELDDLGPVSISDLHPSGKAALSPAKSGEYPAQPGEGAVVVLSTALAADGSSRPKLAV